MRSLRKYLHFRGAFRRWPLKISLDRQAIRFENRIMHTDGWFVGGAVSSILLVILSQSGTSGPPTKAELYFYSWIAQDEEVAYVLDSPRAPAAALPKLLNKTATVWGISNRPFGKLLNLLLVHRGFNVKTVVFTSASGLHLERLLLRRLYASSSRILTHWVLLVDEETFDSVKNSQLRVPSYASVCELGDDKRKAPVVVRCLGKGEYGLPGLPMSRNLARHMKDVAMIETFSGENISVGCVVNKYDDDCNAASDTGIRDLWARKNVTLTLFRFRTHSDMYTDFVNGRTDIMQANVEFVDRTLWSISFADVDFNYKTFYGLANSTRVLSLVEALGSSSCVVLSMSCLFLCALTIAATRVSLRARNFVFVASEEALFLLASLLGTSSPETRLRREVNFRYSLYALWLGCIFPLSVYLRSEFTSMVTVVRPSDHMDTLSELEKALDEDKVLVCVAKLSSAISDLQRVVISSTVFVDKLRASYLRHKGKGIVANTDLGCLRCALGNNRVCFTSKFAFCPIKKKFPDLGVFKEHLNAEVTAFPVQKEFALMRPFRRFMRSIREGRLVKDKSNDCDKGAQSSRVKLELWSFFRHFFVLHGLSLLVLALEFLFARFLGTGSSDTWMD